MTHQSLIAAGQAALDALPPGMRWLFRKYRNDIILRARLRGHGELQALAEFVEDLGRAVAREGGNGQAPAGQSLDLREKGSGV